MKFLPVFILFAASIVSAQSTAVQSSVTSTYGIDGSDIALQSPHTPSYASVFVNGASTWTWASGVTCWYAGGNFSVTINITDGSAAHTVTFDTIDGDSTARVETINGKQVAGFSGGAYTTFPLGPGANTFTFQHVAGANAVLTSILFDTPSPNPAPVSCPASAHSVSLAWQASPSAGVTSYIVTRNGVQIATVMVTSPLTFTDSTVAAGATYTYAFAAVSPSGTSSYLTLAPLTVPSP